MKVLLIFAVGLIASSMTTALPTCQGPMECCEKNWDLIKLDKEECYEFCAVKECDISTGKNEYMEYLADTNIRTFPDGSVRPVGYTKYQRDCMRYWEIGTDDKGDSLWYKSRCCVDMKCTEFPDNYGDARLRNRNLRR
jgi:hypothetical protein